METTLVFEACLTVATMDSSSVVKDTLEVLSCGRVSVASLGIVVAVEGG